jgi:hypothetical protein
MNKNTFFSHASHTALSACKLILIITTLLSAAVSAQSTPEADVAVIVFRHPGTDYADTGEAVFQLHVTTVRSSEQTTIGTGIVLNIELPKGAVPTALPTIGGCSFADGVIHCDIGDIPSGTAHGRGMVFSVKAADGARALSVTARVSANEFDPEINNNTATAMTLVKATRNKSTRVF